MSKKILIELIASIITGLIIFAVFNADKLKRLVNNPAETAPIEQKVDPPKEIAVEVKPAPVVENHVKKKAAPVTKHREKDVVNKRHESDKTGDEETKALQSLGKEGL